MNVQFRPLPVRQMIALFSVLVPMAGATLASAQNVTGPSAKGLSTSWVVDKAHSRFGFTGTQTGTPFRGSFTQYEPQIALDPAHPETGRIDMTIDLASAQTGDRQRDTALPGSDWFDTATFPEAHFVSSAIRRVQGDQYQASGTLTLRGVTQPVTLDFTLDVTGETAHAKGHADLLRSRFGVGQGPWSTGQWVALEVSVVFDLTAHRAG
ncbi:MULTISPECIES: YceI family protein [Asaia]|uniref:YceI family protein n=1 Tax=Asaia TaxID=91914 RepID=UPI002554AF7A|nr:YceI family protein [Asaia sp. HumB]MDL2171690.1 YceI family protein [Asaia sp. HumB]